jgi:hypothetical protein
MGAVLRGGGAKGKGRRRAHMFPDSRVRRLKGGANEIMKAPIARTL